MKSALKAIVIVMLLSASCHSLDPNEIDISKIDEINKIDHKDQRIYGGYLQSGISGQAFYYLLAMSTNKQDNDPVVLWLNGGPGCSSLMGMFSENGPFLFEKGTTKLKKNLNAWNQKAHILYLESPAKVGFSKGNSAISNDTSTAQDNYMALVKFFQTYESLKDNDFYIAGQSYAGIYIPRLADEIISNNQQQSAQERKINLKGILLGNPCTHPTECYSAKYLSRHQVEFMYTRGFVDTVDYSFYKSACLDISETSPDCLSIQKKIHDHFYNSSANIYNVYDVCYPLSPGLEQKKEEKPELGIFRHSLNCSDAVGSNYFFNKNQYRSILYVPEKNNTLLWTPCSDSIKYTIESKAAYTFLPGLVKYGLKIWYFSGDYDAMVPIQGTLFWLQKYRRDFGASIKRNWRPWVWGDNKLGGMVWQLEGLTFYSVIGAGHMVPSDQPEAALHIFHSFLNVDTKVDKTAEE